MTIVASSNSGGVGCFVALAVIGGLVWWGYTALVEKQIQGEWLLWRDCPSEPSLPASIRRTELSSGAKREPKKGAIGSTVRRRSGTRRGRSGGGDRTCTGRETG